MAKISCGEINKSLLFIILMSIFMVLNQYIYGFIYIECFYKMNIYKILYNAIIDSDKEDFPHHRVFDPLFSYLGVIFISLFFLPKEKNKKNDENDNEMINKRESSNMLMIKLIHNDNFNYFSQKKGIIIFILLLILWVLEENLILIYVDIFQDLDFWFFELIFISYFFSKNFIFKIYSHQKLGIAICIGIGSLLKIYNITITFLSSEKEIFYTKYPFLCFFIIFYFLIIIARSFVNTQLKILMDLKFVSYRILLVYYGAVGATICLITGIVTSYVSCPDYMKDYICKIKYDNNLYYDEVHNYIESWQNFLVRLIVIVLGIITFFLNKLFFTLIIKFYTPIHVIFSFPIQFFIEKLFLLIFTGLFFPSQLLTGDNLKKKFSLDISGDITSIIGFLIYLEIIELNFCGLSFNLKKNIILRGEKDYRHSLALDNMTTLTREEQLSFDSNDSKEGNNEDN